MPCGFLLQAINGSMKEAAFAKIAPTSGKIQHRGETDKSLKQKYIICRVAIHTVLAIVVSL